MRHAFTEKFGFDTSAFFADVLGKLNDPRTLPEVLNSRVGGRGLRKEVAQ
jgi:hypothetical protein